MSDDSEVRPRRIGIVGCGAGAAVVAALLAASSAYETIEIEPTVTTKYWFSTGFMPKFITSNGSVSQLRYLTGIRYTAHKRIIRKRMPTRARIYRDSQKWKTTCINHGIYKDF